MSATSASSGPGPAPGRRPWVARAPRWWVSAAVFCAGILVGVLVTGLLSAGTVVTIAPEDPSGAVVPGAAGPVPAGGAGAGIAVNEACLRAVNGAEDAFRTVDDFAAAAGALDAARLDEVVQRLQPVQARLEQDVSQCRVLTGATTGPTPTPSSPATGPTTGVPAAGEGAAPLG